MAWNKYYSDWQDGWSSSGWKNPTWYEQPIDGTRMPSFNTSSPWNGPTGAGQGQGLGNSSGYGAGQGQMPTGVAAGQSSRPGGAIKPAGQPAAASQAKPKKPLSFAAMRAFQGDESDESESEGPSRASNVRNLLDLESTSASDREDRVSRNSNSDEETDRCGSGERRVGKEATQGEIEEAEKVVRKAFVDTKERNRLRTKVGGATQADLQAMLNSRIQKK